MGVLLKQIFGLIKLLNSETGQNQIAAGIAAGFILGMTPAFSLQTVLVIILVLLFRVQLGAVLISSFFFAFMAYILDPLFHSVGQNILQTNSLQPIFTSMYNMPILPFTRFNNTIVMGSAAVTIALFPVIFIISRILIFKYQDKVLKRFKDSKFWKFVKATSFYKWYQKYDELYG
ncbi:MAG: TIGR03546 family protein [Bdellovibrionales bacterium]|nr:TIGR03546 family protein [Bdellovibrionales bacterium]